MSEDISDTPRERSTYTSFSDGYGGFDAREEDGQGKGLMVAGLAIGIVLVLGTVVWNAYRSGTKTDRNDTPVLRAQEGNYKHRLEDAGGLETPNQDKRLFDVMDNNDREAAATQNGRDEADTQPGPPTDLRPQRNTEAATPVQPEPVVTPAPRTPTPEPTLAPAPGETPAFTPPPPITTGFDASGQFLVQLAALRDIEAAQRAWSQMVEAYPTLFAGAEMDIQRADLGARGIFYRVRVAAFTTRGRADEFCTKLKANGESCMVASR